MTRAGKPTPSPSFPPVSPLSHSVCTHGACVVNVDSPSPLRFFFLLVVLIAGAGFVGCQMTTRVDAGHVGIRVKLAGSDRGVQDMPVVTGWVFYNPLTEQIVLFPTSVQNVVWSESTLACEASPSRQVDHASARATA